MVKQTELNNEWRKTSQYLIPDTRPSISEGHYDIYPSFKLQDNQIHGRICLPCQDSFKTQDNNFRRLRGSIF